MLLIACVGGAMCLLSQCTKRYIDPEFRQIYEDHNQILHSDSAHIPYLKIHFANGDVSVMDHWSLDPGADSLRGDGMLYDFNRSLIRQGPLVFDVSSMVLIETNDLSSIKSMDSERITGMSILLALDIVGAILCLSNPKACFGSCPTFYLPERDPTDHCVAEAFSNAIAPSLESTDVDALGSVRDSTVLLSMRNEAMETHVVNALSLLAIPHNDDESVYHDSQGKFYTCAAVAAPIQATVENTSVLEAIASRDGQEYLSKTDSNNLIEAEEIILEFDQGFQEAGLVLTFRQSLLTTFLLYSGISFMGDEASDYFAQIETNPRVRKALSNRFKHLRGIQISRWNPRSERWLPAAEIDEVGPIAQNTQLIRLGS
ncbi:MAG: hypothetical protein R3330_15855, partial [Saprospiraceae bacterium]|nr:hypothetical protein [Saprospiraceae bacterium]